MASRILNTKQLQRRARKVYAAVGNVFEKAQFGKKTKKEVVAHRRTMNSGSARATTFVNDPTVGARIDAFFETIEIGKPWIKKNPGKVTPALVGEFLHRWKMRTAESKAGQYLPHAAYFYFMAKQPKAGEPLRDLQKANPKNLQDAIDAINKETEKVGRFSPKSETVKAQTPFGEVDSYGIGRILGVYAFKLEKRVGIRHCGLYFLALIDAGKTVFEAEEEIERIGRIRKSQTPGM